LAHFGSLIDDESVIREGLSFLLRSAGLKVQGFSSAQEFLTNPPVEPLGCLVVDVQLPGIIGLRTGNRTDEIPSFTLAWFKGCNRSLSVTFEL
jgi:FixJ family two-component response regulator